MIVKKLGIDRKPGYLYYVKGHAVYKKKIQSSAAPTKVMSLRGIKMDTARCFYFISANGDLGCHKRKHSRKSRSKSRRSKSKRRTHTGTRSHSRSKSKKSKRSRRSKKKSRKSRKSRRSRRSRSRR